MTGKAVRKQGGKPHRAPKAPKASTGKFRKPRTNKSTATVSTMDTLEWSKQARRAPWVAGQSMTISPGDPKAVSRYRHQQKFKARKKKVIRPRVRKYKQGGNAYKPPKQ